MEGPESRSDVHVYTGPGVPTVYEDAFAVEEADGRLHIMRWSTRREKKHCPIAGYAPGMWTSYHHVGEQGDEVVEPPRQPQPRRARPQHDAVEQPSRALQPPWEPETDPEPESPAEREAAIRSREPGAPENLRPALVRPALPPKDLPVPTHQLPRRVPAGSGERTEVLPAVRAEQPQQSASRPQARRRTRGVWPRGGGAWLAVVVTALSTLAAVH